MSEWGGYDACNFLVVNWRVDVQIAAWFPGGSKIEVICTGSEGSSAAVTEHDSGTVLIQQAQLEVR